MKKAVLDTNVLISGTLFSGPPRKLLEAALERKFKLVTSPAILSELQRILAEKFGLASEEIIEIEQRINKLASVVETTGIRVNRIKQDPPDNRILEAAKAAKADFIVSGDKRHILPLQKFGQAKIVTSSQLLAELKKDVETD